jgi:RHS repeat-associated protein
VRVEYKYDAFSRRVKKEVHPADGGDARVVQFLWDGDALAQEIDTERGKRVYVHAPGGLVPLLQEEQGEVFAYVTDHLGTAKELIDGSGRVAWSAAHTAWGSVERTFREEGAREVESPWRLLGQYWDEETGLAYTRYRYFDARYGRWVSPDPLGIEGSANLSGFDGVPTGDVDPLGLACPPKGTPPPNMSPAGAGRRGAFREAKRQSGIPVSQQPSRVIPNVDRRGNPQAGRIYEFDRGPGQEPIRIREDAGGHDFGPGDLQNRGPHFNDMAGNHYDY